MSLRPLDMQVMIPKVPEMSQQKQLEQQRAGFEQQYLANETQKQEKQIHQQVIKTNQAEKDTIDSNDGGRQKGTYKKSKRNKRNQDRKKEVAKEGNHKIDIRI